MRLHPLTVSQHLSYPNQNQRGKEITKNAQNAVIQLIMQLLCAGIMACVLHAFTTKARMALIIFTISNIQKRQD